MDIKSGCGWALLFLGIGGCSAMERGHIKVSYSNSGKMTRDEWIAMAWDVTTNTNARVKSSVMLPIEEEK